MKPGMAKGGRGKTVACCQGQQACEDIREIRGGIVTDLWPESEARQPKIL